MKNYVWLVNEKDLIDGKKIVQNVSDKLHYNVSEIQTHFQ